MVGTTFIQGTVSTQVVSSLPFLAIPTASSTGGTNSFTATLLANLNTTVVKAGPGTVYGIQGSNIGSSNVFVRMYQSSTAPSTIASSGVPAMIFPMPVSTNPFFECTVGVTFSSGISFITQQQIYTATTALAVLASTATITILYK
jgi:hypothetical protein